MIVEHFKDLVSWDHKRKSLEEIDNIEACNNIYPKPVTNEAFKKFIKDDYDYRMVTMPNIGKIREKVNKVYKIRFATLYYLNKFERYLEIPRTRTQNHPILIPEYVYTDYIFFLAFKENRGNTIFKECRGNENKLKELVGIKEIELVDLNLVNNPIQNNASKENEDNKSTEVETGNTNRVVFGAKIDLLSKFKPVGKNITGTGRFPDINYFNISVNGYIVSNKITSTIIFTDFYRDELFRIDTSSNADTVVPVYAGMKVSIFSFLIDNNYSNNTSKILYIPAIRYTANTAAGDPAIDFIKEI